MMPSFESHQRQRCALY